MNARNDQSWSAVTLQWTTQQYFQGQEQWDFGAGPSPEGINDNLAFDTLDWVHHYSHSPWIQLLKALH